MRLVGGRIGGQGDKIGLKICDILQRGATVGGVGERGVIVLTLR